MSASGGDSEATGTPLVGRGATQADFDLVVSAISAGPEVEKLISISTRYLAADELLIAAKIALTSDKAVREAADDVVAIKQRIREAVPIAGTIYLETDIYRPSIDPEPPTDTFVLKSAD